MKRIAILALAAAWLSGSEARANGTHLPDLVDVLLVPGDETRVAIEANFGLLESTAGGPFTWTCHETIVSINGVVPAYTANGDGVLLGSARLVGFGTDPEETVYRSVDGCTWTTVTGLTGIAATAIAFDPGDPSHAFAAASNGGTGTINALWVSNDAGLSWSKTSIEVSHYVNGVRFAEADPQVVWATSSDLPNDEAWVYWSSNGGVSFATHPWLDQPSGLSLGSLAVVATSPADVQTAWVRSYGVTSRIWLTTNGGVAFDEVLAVGGIVDVDALPDGRVWVATSTSGFFVALDGRTFTSAGDVPQPRGFAHDGRGLFTAGSLFLDPFPLTVSTSGDPRTNATGVFRLADLAGPKPCPAGSTVAVACDPIWPAMQTRLGLAPGRVPTPVAKFAEEDRGVAGGGGCACSTNGTTTPAPGALCVLVLLALRLAALAQGERASGRPRSSVRVERAQRVETLALTAPST